MPDPAPVISERLEDFARLGIFPDTLDGGGMLQLMHNPQPQSAVCYTVCFVAGYCGVVILEQMSMCGECQKLFDCNDCRQFVVAHAVFHTTKKFMLVMLHQSLMPSMRLSPNEPWALSTLGFAVPMLAVLSSALDHLCSN